jgi:hypothetical protein|tara:strand:- start:16332 stop:16820 length:489 start_codon:yes stop_codon:yes gene_type:complete
MKDITPKMKTQTKERVLGIPVPNMRSLLGGLRGYDVKKASVEGEKLADDALGSSQIADDAVTTAKIANLAVTLGKLASIVAPTRVVKYSGVVTWTGSGTSFAPTVSGVLSTDIVMANIVVKPTQAAYLVSTAPTANTITFVLSEANTSNDAQIAYTVFRATS